jgi:hypothetical protein
MDVNKLAGACFIIFGIINMLHEITLRASGRGEPGFAEAFVTALLITLGAAFFLRKSAVPDTRSPKAKGPSILED